MGLSFDLEESEDECLTDRGREFQITGPVQSAQSFSLHSTVKSSYTNRKQTNVIHVSRETVMIVLPLVHTTLAHTKNKTIK